MNSKRGVSNIISIVLIIMIVLVSILILYNVLIPFVSNSKIDNPSLLIGLDLKEVIVFVNGASKISVNRNSEPGELSSLKFVFSDAEGKTHIETIKENLTSELETKTYSFSPFSDISGIESVSVFPVIGESIGREFRSDHQVINMPAGLVSWFRLNNEEDYLKKNHGELKEGSSFENSSLYPKGGFFEIKDDPSLNFDREMSLSIWVFPYELANSIISKGNEKVNYQIISQNNGKILFSFSENSGLNSTGSEMQINKNEWDHVVVSVNWNGIYKIFINGNLSNYGNFNTVPLINNESIILGKGFDGKMKELMIFDKALSNEQIATIYRDQKN